MMPTMGIPELLVLCIVGLAGVGLPVAVLVVLVMVYTRLKNIEKLLKKDQ